MPGIISYVSLLLPQARQHGGDCFAGWRWQASEESAPQYRANEVHYLCSLAISVHLLVGEEALDTETVALWKRGAVHLDGCTGCRVYQFILQPVQCINIF